jgi:hypothetical protein
MKTIKLTGPFSDADIGEFVALLRRIDDANPTGLYVMQVTDPDMAEMDKTERFVAGLLPPLDGRLTRFARASYRDDAQPPRACDQVMS